MDHNIEIDARSANHYAQMTEQSLFLSVLCTLLYL